MARLTEPTTCFTIICFTILIFPSKIWRSSWPYIIARMFSLALGVQGAQGAQGPQAAPGQRPHASRPTTALRQRWWRTVATPRPAKVPVMFEDHVWWVFRPEIWGFQWGFKRFHLGNWGKLRVTVSFQLPSPWTDFFLVEKNMCADLSGDHEPQ